MEPEINKADYTRALNLMTRYLAMRDHSRFELQTKLCKRFAAELVHRLLSEAEQNNWLPPEEQIAERAVRAWQRQGKSRRYIEGQLGQRRLPLPPTDDTTELENIRALLERKFGDFLALSQEERDKAQRFLIYRGFSTRMIGMVLNAQEF